MEKIINELINNSIKGIDTYRWKDATWLIVTDQTRWVVELTDEGTLWYNYKFFQDIFKYVSLEGSKEFEGYIIQWANDYFFKGINDTKQHHFEEWEYVGDIIEGGVKDVKGRGKNHGDEFEWHTRAVVDNGVKGVKPNVVFHGVDNSSMSFVDCSGNNTDIWMIVEEGIKNIYPDRNPYDYDWSDEFKAGDVIECGVKV